MDIRIKQREKLKRLLPAQIMLANGSGGGGSQTPPDTWDSFLFFDDFDDNSLDSVKWTQVNSSLVVVTEASQRAELTITTGSVSGTVLNGKRGEIIDVTSIGYDVVVLSAFLNWETGVTNVKGGILLLAKDATNRAQFSPGSSNNSKLRVIALDTGGAESALETTYDKGTNVKIVYNTSTHAISWQIWSAGAWVEVQTGNVDLGTTIYAFLHGQNSNTTAVTAKTIYDSLYVTNFDFSTQYPVSNVLDYAWYDPNPKEDAVTHINCFGDSITVGEGSTGGNTGYTTRLATLTGLTIVNNGISGQTLQQEGYARYQANLITSANFNNVVILFMCTNDVMRCGPPYSPALFKIRLQYIVNQLIVKDRYSKTRILLSTTGYISEDFLLDPERSANFQCGTLARQAEINTAVQEVAEEYGTLFCDLFTIMSSVGDPDALLSDGLHPNDAGHQLIADSFYAVIQDSLGN